MNRPKYNNTKIPGYDSLAEKKRHDQLLIMERAGEITNLNRQVKYLLIPEQREEDTVGPKGGVKKGKIIERECSYIADFTYWQNGELVVEDVKGYIDKASGAYAKFSIKKKLMLERYGIRVKVVVIK